MKPIHFVLGVAAGAVAGLLLAPKSGAKNRAYVAKKAQQGADYAKRSADASAEYLQQQGDRLKRNAADFAERTSAGVAGAVENALDAAGRAYADTFK